MKCVAPHLQGVHKVLNQEEAAHLLKGSVDVGQTGVHVLAESLWGDADILIYQRSVGWVGTQNKAGSKVLQQNVQFQYRKTH